VSARAARIAIAALSLAGVAITTYLLYTRYSGHRIACPTGGCETVQESRYAELAGIPVAAIGLAGYLTLLATTFVRSEAGRAAAVAISLAGLAFGAYLLIVQLTVLDAICAWCVASDAVLLLITVTAVTDAMRPAPPRPGRVSPQASS
jgi:uncharacterized membrane protein